MDCSEVWIFTGEEAIVVLVLSPSSQEKDEGRESYTHPVDSSMLRRAFTHDAVREH